MAPLCELVNDRKSHGIPEGYGSAMNVVVLASGLDRSWHADHSPLSSHMNGIGAMTPVTSKTRYTYCIG